MSDLMTHVVAMVVAVGVTLLIVGTYNNATTSKSKSIDSKSSDTGGGATAAAKKNKKKKNKKKAAAAAPAAVVTPPPAAAFKSVPKIEEPASKPKAAAPKIVENAGVEEEMNKTVVEQKQQQQQQQNGNSGGGGKKKKKIKKKKAPAAALNGTSTPAPVVVEPPSQVSAPAPPTSAPPVVVVPLQPRIVIEEEWATIPVQKKKKKTRKIAAAADAASSSAASTVVKESVTIDASRVGIIIGPKGATMNLIQEKTGVKLDVNAPKLDENTGGTSNQFRPVVGGGSRKKATATVVLEGGTSETRAIAKRAILELADRGYAALLQAESFGESTLSVHPKYLSEIVGTGGKVIKLIQSELNVKLTIPKNDWTPKTVQVGNIAPSCRVGIAGDDPKNVKLAKQVIKDLCNYHHHEITHPGFNHQEVYVPHEFFHCVIGPRGSEIKHIRGNYHVDVYMPASDSITENVICVGKPNDVEKAISYIKLLMDRDSELREAKYSDEAYGADNDDSYGW